MWGHIWGRQYDLTDSRHPSGEVRWEYLYTDRLGSNPVNDDYCDYPKDDPRMKDMSLGKRREE